MTEDAQLTDFLEGDGKGGSEPETGSSARDGGDVTAEGDPSSAGANADEAVEPARPTYAWGDGYACSGCGAAIDRAWRGDDGLVCESCKEW